MNSPHVPNFSFFMNKTNRLRDVLVPIEVFIDMMNYLEDTNIQMRFSDDSKEHSNLWICPYPYPAPAKGFVQCNGGSISDYARYQEKTINYLKNFSADQKYRMLYCFHYIKEDSFNPKGIPLLAGKGLTAMDLEINLDISSYIIDQYKKHEKIICIF